MNPGMFGFVGQSSGGAIKSIQRGTINATTGGATATITPVNTAKTELRYLGGSGMDSVSSSRSLVPRLVLTNSTTITATINENSANSIVSWELTEWA
jgi:hypothetical protein